MSFIAFLYLKQICVWTQKQDSLFLTSLTSLVTITEVGLTSPSVISNATFQVRFGFSCLSQMLSEDKSGVTLEGSSVEWGFSSVWNERHLENKNMTILQKLLAWREKKSSSLLRMDGPDKITCIYWIYTYSGF